MVKLSILLKGIVLYVIFVIGMSIVLEYLSGSKSQLDIKIDEILDTIKNEIKENFIKKAKEHFEDVTMRGSDAMIGKPRRPLGMGYPLGNYNPEYENNKKIDIQQETDEEKIIKAVNERLKYSNMNFDNQMYANINQNNNQNYIPLATTSDFSYTPVDYNWETNSLSNPKMDLPKYNTVNVDNYQYQFPQSNTQGLLPAKLGIDPSTYHS
jgi:hypothetical protein